MGYVLVQGRDPIRNSWSETTEREYLVYIGTTPRCILWRGSTRVEYKWGRVVIVDEHSRRRPFDVKSCGNEVAAFAAWLRAQMTNDT